MRKKQILFVFSVLLLLVVIIPKISFQMTLTVTIVPDKPTYTQRELVTLKGNVTDDVCCKGLVKSGLMGIQVENPLSKTITLRTLPLTDNNTENFPVEIVSLFMCDDGGNYKSNIERDKDIYFKATVLNKIWYDDRNMYISITIVDKNLIPIETSQASKTIPRGSTSFSMPRMHIANWAAVGTAYIYAAVYTAWPNDFGYPLCPEKTAYFNIIESVYVVPPITIPPAEPIQNGTFEMKFTLAPDMIPGTYLVSAAAWHNGTSKSAFTSFKGNYTELPPLASFAVKPPQAGANYTIDFDASSSSAEGYNDSIASYYWKFGDGDTATVKRPTHSYDSFGNYTVTLNVTDHEGFWNTTSKIVRIADIHEISLKSIQCPSTIYNMWTVYVVVVITNEGTMPENFNVKLYVNNSLVYTKQVSLDILETQSVTLTWDTAGIQVLSYYNVRVDADILLNELNTTDNTLAFGPIWTLWLGDVDGNRIIDIFDVATVSIVYGANEGEPGWYLLADLVRDGTIDIYDIVVVTVQYDEEY